MAVDSTSPGRLNTWKEIASYLEKDVRTAMRWRKDRGLPVHFVPGGRRHAVFAYPHEIDLWMSGALAPAITPPASGRGEIVAAPTKRARGPLTRDVVLIISAVVASVAVVVFWPMKRAESIQFRDQKQLTSDGFEKEGLVTDGTYVYFGEIKDGRQKLARVMRNGGAVETLASPSVNALPVDISSDGQRLLVLASGGHESERELWIVPLQGQMMRIGQVRCHSGAWTPDTKTIACLSGRTLLTVDRGGNGQSVMTFVTVPQQLRWFEKSHSFKFLLCDGNRTACSVWEMPLSSDNIAGRPHELSSPISGCCLQLSTSGSKDEFFATPLDDSERALIRGERDNGGTSTGFSAVKIGTEFAAVGIAADPHGSKLFLISGEQRRADLLRFDLTAHAFQPVLPGVNARYLDFSRQGDRVAYVNAEDHSLWVSRADGSDPRRLYSGANEVELPRWSPDATQVSFLTKLRGRPWRILVIPASGGIAREVSQDSENQGAPTWSPDGNRLAYGNVACEEDRSCAIHTVDLASGKVSTLPNSTGLRTARWSPDGKHIAAMDFTKHEVVLFDLATSKWRTIGHDINGDDLSWSADSGYLYANRASGDTPEILRLPIVPGRSRQTVLDLETMNKLTGRVVTWFCLAPDGSIIIERNLDTSDIFAVDWGRSN